MGIAILLLAAILMALGMGMVGKAMSMTKSNEVVCVVAPAIELTEEEEWAEFHAESFSEHAAAFDALFNSYTYKVSKNGRSMINGKFVAMPK